MSRDSYGRPIPPYRLHPSQIPPSHVYTSYDVELIDDGFGDDSREHVTEYNHSMKTVELKKLDQEQLVEMFNEISRVIKSRIYGGCKPEELHQTQLRIDTILHEKFDHELNLNHDDDTDWKNKGKDQASGDEDRSRSKGRRRRHG